MNRVLGSLDPAFALRTKILGYYNERSYGAILVMVIAFIGKQNPRSFKSKSFEKLLTRIWKMGHCRRKNWLEIQGRVLPIMLLATCGVAMEAQDEV